MTLYYNNAVDNAWDTLGNWWQDAACTVPAAALPVTGDALVFVNGSYLDSEGPAIPIQPLSVRFEGNASTSGSEQLGYMTCTFTFVGTSRCGCDNTLQRALFYESASLSGFGTVAYAELHDSAINHAGQLTVGKFYDNAINYSPAELPVVSADFYGSSKNGAIEGVSTGHCVSATFHESSINEGTVTNLLTTAILGSTGWTLARSPTAIGGTITNVIVTNIGTVPSAANVRRGTAVGVSPAAGTLDVPAASDVRFGVAVDAGTGTMTGYVSPAVVSTLSRREAILANRLSALQQVLLYTDTYTARPCKIVERIKASFWNPPQLPALYLYSGNESVERSGNALICRLPVFVDLTSACGNDVPETHLNALIAQVEAVMAADQSCGGLAEECLEKSVIFGAEPGDDPRVIAILQYEITYRRALADPTKSR